MRNTWLIARRELGSYFASPIAYAVTAVFLLIMGGVFGLILYYSGEATMRYVFYNFYAWIFLVIAGPLLTMRLVAEERKSGTIELLLTSPVRDGEVIVGKYVAALLVWLLMLGLTLVFPLLLKVFGNPDLGPIVAGYLGFVLVEGAILAVGVFASTLTSNQIVAAVIALGLTLLFTLTEAIGDLVSGSVRDALSYLSLFSRSLDFPKGVIDTKDVVFFLTLIIAALFMATRSLESRRYQP